MAAAIGCELPVQEASGCMVVDIGGGTAEIGVLSLGGLIYGKSIPAGGDRFDRAIAEYVRQQHGIAIGEATSERIKKDISAAHPSCFESDNREVQVSGQKIAEGVPGRFTISARDVHEAFQPALADIVKAVRVALGEGSPRIVGGHCRPRDRSDRRRGADRGNGLADSRGDRRAGAHCRRPP